MIKYTITGFFIFSLAACGGGGGGGASTSTSPTASPTSSGISVETGEEVTEVLVIDDGSGLHNGASSQKAQ